MPGGYMMGPPDRQTLETRGRRAAHNLAATLTAAGLDDPDILALAAEADALRLASKHLPVKTSKGGVCGDDSSCDGSPDSPLIGTMPGSPVRSTTTGHRHNSLSPSLGRKPAALGTNATAPANRNSSIGGIGRHRATPQTSNGGYAAAAAAHQRVSSPTQGVSAAVAAACALTRRSSLGSQQQQQQQQQQYVPPHAVAFGSTVPVASVPNPPTRKLSADLALYPAQLTRRSSLGESTHSVAFGSTVRAPGSASPTRGSSAGIARGVSLSRQNSSSNFNHMLSALTRRSSLGAGGLSRKNSGGTEAPRFAFASNCARELSPREASSPGLRLSMNGRSYNEQSKNSIGGARCASASPTRTNRIPGGASPYSGAAKAAVTAQAVTSPFAAASGRAVEIPSPRVVHSTFIVDNGINRSSSLGHNKGACGSDGTAFQAAAAAVVAAAAAAVSSRHRRTPSLPAWQSEEDQQNEEISDADNDSPNTTDLNHHHHHHDHAAPAAYEYQEASISGTSSSSPVCEPTPAALPIESADEHQDASAGYVREDYVPADKELEYVSYGAGEPFTIDDDKMFWCEYGRLQDYVTAEKELEVVSNGAGEKLPVLREEQADKEVNSNGSSPRAGTWGNLMAGRNKARMQYGGGPRGTSVDSDGSPTAATKQSETIRIHSSTGEQRTNSTSREYFTDRKQRARKRRKMCLIWGIPIVLVAIVVSVIAGFYGSKHHSAKNSSDLMAFEITLGAPAKPPSQGCSSWFGSDENQYISAAGVFGVCKCSERTGSYHKGRLHYLRRASVYGTDGASYKPSPGRNATRLLLSREGLESMYRRSLQQMAPAPVPASASTWLDIRTVIAVPAPADLSRRSQILETVSSNSANILAGPISQFLQVQSLVVRSADPVVANTPPPPATEKQPTGSSDLLDPESGELTDEDFALPVAVDGNFATLPTAAAAADGSSTSVVNSTGTPASSDAAESHFADVAPDAPITLPGSVAEAPSSTEPATVAASAPAAAPAAATAEQTTVVAPTELELSTFPWNPIKKIEAYTSAPACLFSPTQTNSVTDAHGRLWSLMNDKECAFRPQELDNARIGTVPITWEAAPVCIEPPTNTNFVLDTSRHLWGWQNGQTCAFRGKYQPPGLIESLLNAKPLAVPEKIPMVWDNAAMCPFGPTKTNSVLDAFGRMWSWNNGKSCAFRYST